MYSEGGGIRERRGKKFSEKRGFREGRILKGVQGQGGSVHRELREGL